MKTTTQKAEGLLNTPGLSQGEKQFLQSILEFLEQAKDDPKPDVALAARKWDRAIGFFMKVRLRRKSKGVSRQNAEVRSTSPCPSPQSGGETTHGNAVERIPTNIHELREAA